jgi:hypothetical protein
LQYNMTQLAPPKILRINLTSLDPIESFDAAPFPDQSWKFRVTFLVDTQTHSDLRTARPGIYNGLDVVPGDFITTQRSKILKIDQIESQTPSQLVCICSDTHRLNSSIDENQTGESSIETGYGLLFSVKNKVPVLFPLRPDIKGVSTNDLIGIIGRFFYAAESSDFLSNIGFTGSQGIPGEYAGVGFTGSIGFTGSQGAGFTGSQGNIGFTGSQGIPGEYAGIGFTGSIGYTGSQGAGFTGSRGYVGFTGSTGSTGFVGSKGGIGFTGSQGEFGFTGSKGERGDPGFRGFHGFTGSAGFVGSAGTEGTIGYTGSRGEQGLPGEFAGVGFTGSRGDTGFTGSQGIGFTGSQGDIGFAGFTGSQGDTGFTGSQGDTGFTGSQGDIGYTGSLGDLGFTGSQGDIGYTGSQGEIGETGFVGSHGSSAYEIAVGNGFTGSEQEWLDSLGSSITVTPNSGLSVTGSTISSVYNTLISDDVQSISLGGASSQPASVWKSKNIVEVLDTILFPDVAPSYTIPTISVSGAQSGIKEIGSTVSQSLSLTAVKNDAGEYTILNLSRGSTLLTSSSTPAGTLTTAIAPQFGYQSPNNPNYSYSITTTDPIIVINGSISWTGNGTYSAGLAKQNNKGVTDTRPAAVRSNNAPQAAASISGSTITITGIYPYFWGKSSTQPTASSIANAIVSGTANKVLAAASGTLSVTYNAAGEYVWLAHAASYTTKTKWYNTELNQGNIGPGNFILTPVSQLVNSPDTFWTNINFSVYISDGATNTNGALQFRNS